MAKIEAFLSLEASLTTKVQAAVGKATKKAYKAMATAIKAGEFDRATRIANDLDLTPAAVAVRKYVKYITSMALMFGAGRAAEGTTKTTAESADLVMTQTLHSFEASIIQGGKAYLLSMALQLISEARAAAPGESPVHKAERIIKPFESFMDEAGKAYMNIVSSLHTSRVSAYGFTAEAFALGIDKYQITEQLDNRICPVCAEMHGKTFKVEAARKLLDVALRVLDPQDLKHVQPWPSQSKDSLKEIRRMTSEQLIAQGWHVPPYHPRCRGLLSKVGSVEPIPGIQLKADDTEGWRSWAETLSESGQKALKLYASQDYAKINEALRKLKMLELSEERLAAIEELDAVFLKSPVLSESASLYRGLQASDSVTSLLNSVEVGSVITDRAFVSTSLSKDVAFSDFADAGGIQVVITADKGSRVVGLHSHLLTKQQEEREVLLPRGSKFKVTSITNVEGQQRVLELELLS